MYTPDTTRLKRKRAQIGRPRARLGSSASRVPSHVCSVIIFQRFNRLWHPRDQSTLPPFSPPPAPPLFPPLHTLDGILHRFFLGPSHGIILCFSAPVLPSSAASTRCKRATWPALQRLLMQVLASRVGGSFHVPPSDLSLHVRSDGECGGWSETARAEISHRNSHIADQFPHLCSMALATCAQQLMVTLTASPGCCSPSQFHTLPPRPHPHPPTPRLQMGGAGHAASWRVRCCQWQHRQVLSARAFHTITRTLPNRMHLQIQQMSGPL